MRRIVTLLSAALILFSVNAIAQEGMGKVTGKVIDGSKKTIESSTITLIRAKDSSVAKISAADKNGNFEFEKIPEGKYFVSVSAVGHDRGYSEIFEITAGKNSVELKTIELVSQTKSLSGVTVTAKKPLVEQKLDRT
ncbi:MAG: carboxypeptidase regulatory-like domain-containing protein, partial [Bacteroidetes bacterium]